MMPFSVMDAINSEIPHDLPRLIGVRVEQVDRHNAPHRRPGGRRQRLHIVLVVPHPQRVR